MPTLLEPHRVMSRSQSGPSAGKWLSALPVCPETTLTTPRMQCALRRRLRWPLPLPDRHCKAKSCKRELDVYGDHLAACPRTGLLKQRGAPLERAWARAFREAGGLVRDNALLRDTNLAGIQASDQRRLEIVVSGLPLARGIPLGVDVTMVSPLHSNGTSRAHA